MRISDWSSDVCSSDLVDRAAFVRCEGETLAELRKLVASCRLDVPDALPPALALLVGNMGYETIGLVEDLPVPHADAIGVPAMTFVRPSLLLVFDRLKEDRKSVVSGKSVAVRVDLGGRRNIKKKTHT